MRTGGVVEQQMARVNVTDELWLEFRRSCLEDGVHVSDRLGRLVVAELQRRRRSSAPTAPARRRDRPEAQTLFG